jgi:hypothetical protein
MAVLGDELYVGETISCLVTATDPTAADAAITDLDCSLEFFAPPKNPKANVEDRTPDADTALSYDDERGGYYGLVETADWVPGTWFYKVELTGSRTNWAYGKFRIRA